MIPARFPGTNASQRKHTDDADEGLASSSGATVLLYVTKQGPDSPHQEVKPYCNRAVTDLIPGM